MRLGILGGTFNPIHNGHLRVAQAACRERRLDQVLFVVAKKPPHKETSGLAPARDRFRMVQLATAPFPYFSASRLEISRPGPSYTIDTIRRILARERKGTEIYFIIGTDTVPELPTWKEVVKLASLVHFLCVTRKGFPLEKMNELDDLFGPEKAIEIKESAIIMKPVQVSSTDIRRRVAEGKPIDRLTPEPVVEYIRAHNLYRALR